MLQRIWDDVTVKGQQEKWTSANYKVQIDQMVTKFATGTLVPEWQGTFSMPVGVRAAVIVDQITSKAGCQCRDSNCALHGDAICSFHVRHVLDGKHYCSACWQRRTGHRTGNSRALVLLHKSRLSTVCEVQLVRRSMRSAQKQIHGKVRPVYFRTIA